LVALAFSGVILPSLVRQEASYSYSSSKFSATQADASAVRMRELSSLYGQRESSLEQPAVALAIRSRDFQSLTKRLEFTFNSIFTRWSSPTGPGGLPTNLDDVNVVYSYNSPKGWGINVVVTEDATASRVISVTAENESIHFRNSATGSGYEFYQLSSPGVNTPVWNIGGGFHVPSVSNPNHLCDWNHCDFAPWQGLVHDLGGGSGCGGTGCIVQTGTDSGLYCTWFGCGPNHGGYYWGWYEYPPAGPVNCFDVAPNDTIYTFIYSEGESGGSTNHYHTFLSDDSNGRACSSDNSNYDMGGSPIYGEALGERPADSLPQFATYPMWCTVNGNIAYSAGCYDLYSAGYDVGVTMVNCAYQNIQVNSVDSTNTFTQQYTTSGCT